MTFEEYEKRIKIIKDKCGAMFLQVRYDHACIFNGDWNIAGAMTFVMNKMVMMDSNIKDRRRLRVNDMYIESPSEEMERRMGFKKDRRIRVVNYLESLKVFEVQHREGNITWIRINTYVLEELEKAYREQERTAPKITENDQKSGIPKSRKSGNQKSGIPKSEVGNPEIPIYKDKESSKKHSCSPARSARGGNDDPPLKQFKLGSQDLPPEGKLAHHLHKILLKYNKVMRTVKPEKWSCRFKELLTTVPFERIEQVLNWYDKNFGGKYTARAYSASSFVEKYFNIEQAMIDDEGYSACINEQLFFETTIKDGKLIQTPCTSNPPEYIYDKLPDGKVKRIDVEKLLSEGKQLPPWHWDNPKSFNRKAYVTKGV